VAATLTTLTEFNLGPCNENQSILCNNKRLMTYMNENILKIPIDFTLQTPKENDKISVFSKAIEVVFFTFLLIFSHFYQKTNNFTN